MFLTQSLVILIIKKRPKINKSNEGIFNNSLEINGIGTVRAIYKEIRELLQEEEFKFFIMWKVFIQSGNLKSLIFNFDPILCAHA